MSEDNGHGDAELVPTEAGLPDVVLDAYLIENEAEAWGIDLRNASHTQQKVWAEQERFLEGFRTGGTIAKGLANVSVCRRTVELWRQHDLLSFQDRFLAAHEASSRCC